MCVGTAFRYHAPMKRADVIAWIHETNIQSGLWRWLAVVGALWLIVKAVHPQTWRIETSPDSPSIYLVQDTWWGFGPTQHNLIRHHNTDRGWEIRRDGTWSPLDIWDSRWDQCFGIVPEGNPYDDRDF